MGNFWSDRPRPEDKKPATPESKKRDIAFWKRQQAIRNRTGIKAKPLTPQEREAAMKHLGINRALNKNK